MKGFSREEVARHRSKDSLWIAHADKVYDVTDFVQRHPGGADILVEHAGGCVSDVMSSSDPHQHSNAAYQILNKYYIGDLIDSANPKVRRFCSYYVHEHNFDRFDTTEG